VRRWEKGRWRKWEEERPGMEEKYLDERQGAWGREACTVWLGCPAQMWPHEGTSEALPSHIWTGWKNTRYKCVFGPGTIALFSSSDSSFFSFISLFATDGFMLKCQLVP
jgi:hypothetical protein